MATAGRGRTTTTRGRAEILSLPAGYHDLGWHAFPRTAPLARPPGTRAPLQPT